MVGILGNTKLYGGFKLEVQRLGYCAVLLVASARVNARAKV